MLKSFTIFVLYVLLLSYSTSFNSFPPGKTIFTPGQIKTYSNGLKNKNLEVEIKFKSEDGKIIIGDKGVLSFKTDFNDASIFDLSKIGQDSLFKTEFIDEKERDFNASCKFWITSDNKISLFCNLDSLNFENGEHYIRFKNKYFGHNNMLVWVIFPQEKIKIEKLDFSIPFLYSDRQTININDETSYELKFKIEEYYDEPLYIYGSNNNYGNLDNCQKIDKELICKISKEKIEEILVNNKEQFKLGAMNENYGAISFDNVLDITINYENVKKQDIYLQIKEIIGGTTKKGVPVCLVTNVTDIPNFISAKFDDMKYFKKVSGRPLILFYNYSFEIEYNIKSNFTEEVVINDIHYKYNFRIQPSKFEGHISVKEEGTDILLSYTKELIYNGEETIKIMYIMNNPSLVEKIPLIPYDFYSSPDLKCINLNKMKLCSVPKFYFDKKQSENYYSRHYNYDPNKYTMIHLQLKLLLPSK